VKFGDWEIKRVWQVVRITEYTQCLSTWGTKAAMRGQVGMLKARGKWNPACHVNWRWEVYRHGRAYRMGRIHVRSMQGTG
jgi:hypothetical protein